MEGGSSHVSREVGAVAASRQRRPAQAGWITTSSGCLVHHRGPLYKICANKKIGESEGKKAHHHGHHPEVQSLSEEKIKKKKDGRDTCRTLEKKTRVECACGP